MHLHAFIDVCASVDLPPEVNRTLRTRFSTSRKLISDFRWFDVKSKNIFAKAGVAKCPRRANDTSNDTSNDTTGTCKRGDAFYGGRTIAVLSLS